MVRKEICKYIKKNLHISKIILIFAVQLKTNKAMKKMQCKTIENYVVDITTKVINGYDKLELVFGNKYEIHYGIHQGIYEYVGKVVENKLYPNDELFTGEHLFRNCKSGEISFGYHGTYSPFEFTRIVRTINN